MKLKHSLVTGVACATIALGLPAAFTQGAFATNTSNIKGEATQATQNQLKSAQQRYEEAQNKLRDLSAQAEIIQNNLYQTQEDLKKTESDIETTKKEIDTKQTELTEKQGVLSERVASNYKTGNSNLISVILNADDFNDFVSRVYYMGKVSEQDARIIKEVKDIKTELENQQKALDARLKEQKELESKQKTEKEQADALVKETQDYTNSLDSEVKALYAKAQQEEAADRERKIAEAREAARRDAAAKEAERKAAEAAQQNNASNAQNNRNNNAQSANNKSASTATTSSAKKAPGKPSLNVVENALRYLGKPYVWGADGPNSFDCSGLTMRAYAEAGVSLPHSSAAQYSIVKSKGNLVTDQSLLVPGDLCFYYSPVHHVAIYVGNGKMVHAPNSGSVVRVDSVNVWGNFVGGGSPK